MTKQQQQTAVATALWNAMRDAVVKCYLDAGFVFARKAKNGILLSCYKRDKDLVWINDNLDEWHFQHGGAINRERLFKILFDLATDERLKSNPLTVDGEHIPVYIWLPNFDVLPPDPLNGISPATMVFERVSGNGRQYGVNVLGIYPISYNKDVQKLYDCDVCFYKLEDTRWLIRHLIEKAKF